MRKFGKHTTPPSRAVERAVRFACAAGGVAAACLLLLLTITTPQAQAGDNPVAGSGQTGIDRPLTADRPGEYPLDRGTTGSGADFGAPASTPLLRGTPKAGSGDPNRLGAQGSPYRSESSGRLAGRGWRATASPAGASRGTEPGFGWSGFRCQVWSFSESEKRPDPRRIQNALGRPA